ncbi:hypothetical protein CONPUDRAFT_159659 [Coniophora puteana RWD-64-598 SS2]|uniref:Uncharacterized protein n=1 Tax=Coniophora puteana (strain RWD-64-598) TaxID=741705 RepID=A0A5M3M750_CONPW|nr:uncharacterized protein CONPUDRAFT_159659 [Coniophora puteana RWD-64-598 SS2]EIW74883.1 hypothetical protein CONPUDRAFT_159659 [Coniophora puteana RWD-64-598 SS2]
MQWVAKAEPHALDRYNVAALLMPTKLVIGPKTWLKTSRPAEGPGVAPRHGAQGRRQGRVGTISECGWSERASPRNRYRTRGFVFLLIAEIANDESRIIKAASSSRTEPSHATPTTTPTTSLVFMPTSMQDVGDEVDEQEAVNTGTGKTSEVDAGDGRA